MMYCQHMEKTMRKSPRLKSYNRSEHRYASLSITLDKLATKTEALFIVQRGDGSQKKEQQRDAVQGGNRHIRLSPATRTSSFLSSSDSKFLMFTPYYEFSSHAACLQGENTWTKEHKYPGCLCYKRMNCTPLLFVCLEKVSTREPRSFTYAQSLISEPKKPAQSLKHSDDTKCSSLLGLAQKSPSFPGRTTRQLDA